MRQVIKTWGSGGTASGIRKLCFRWRRKISFTRQLFYTTPDERTTDSHWIEVLISPLYSFSPPVTGHTASIYIHVSTFDILNLEDESTALSRNVGHQSSRDAPPFFFFFRKTAQRGFFRKLCTKSVYLVTLFVPWLLWTSLLRSMDRAVGAMAEWIFLYMPIFSWVASATSRRLLGFTQVLCAVTAWLN